MTAYIRTLDGVTMVRMRLKSCHLKFDSEGTPTHIRIPVLFANRRLEKFCIIKCHSRGRRGGQFGCP